MRRWNGSSWIEVGAGSATGGGISNNNNTSTLPSLAIASDGTPYVSWQDTEDGDYEIYVRQWNGTGWAEVGAGSATGGGISNNDSVSSDPSIGIAPDDTLYVAWKDHDGADNEIYVRHWSGNDWEEVGINSTSDGGISNNSGTSTGASVAIALNGTPYTAWSDNTGGNFEIYVRRWLE